MDQLTHHTFLTLMQTQRRAREEVVGYQLQLLERLCRHARDQAPFYRDTGRLKPLFGRGDSFDPNAWADVPILSREEAWRHRGALNAGKVPEVMNPLILGNTTGSTGTPLPFYETALGRTMAEAQLARALVWRGLGVLNPIVISKAVTGDAAGRQSQLSVGDPPSVGKGPVHYVDFHLPPGEQIAQVAGIGPRLVMTYPSIALGWIEAGFDFKGVHALVLTGETCSPEMRGRIEAAFSGHVVEIYSASEAGPIAIEGPTRRGGTPVLNVCEENVFLENPASPSGLAEPQPVVVTPLYSYGTPLIRYAAGDYAIFNRSPARDTPGLRRLDRVAGRLRNMFKRRDGTSFWPNLSGVRLMAIAPHTHRQLIQMDYDRFLLRVVFDAPPSAEQEAQIRAHVSDVTGGGDIAIEAVNAIDDGRKQGKAYENFVCRIS